MQDKIFEDTFTNYIFKNNGDIEIFEDIFEDNGNDKIIDDESNNNIFDNNAIIKNVEYNIYYYKAAINDIDDKTFDNNQFKYDDLKFNGMNIDYTISINMDDNMNNPNYIKNFNDHEENFINYINLINYINITNYINNINGYEYNDDETIEDHDEPNNYFHYFIDYLKYIYIKQ